MSMTCLCGAEIHVSHAQHRGRLANEIASVGSSIVRLIEELHVLRLKRYSKNFQAQHDVDLAKLNDALNALACAEGRLAGLKFLQKEQYRYL